jgi:hypothetical protein
LLDVISRGDAGGKVGRLASLRGVTKNVFSRSVAMDGIVFVSVLGAVMRRNFAAAFTVMLASAGVAWAPAAAFPQVSAKTDFQVENLLKAGYGLQAEMFKAEDKGCLTEAAIKAFEARIQRLSDERDSLTLHVPDFLNFYPNRTPPESPNSLLNERIHDLRETLFELKTCFIFGQPIGRYHLNWRSSSAWTELSLGTYVIGTSHADQTSIETDRVTDIQSIFHARGDLPGVGFVATYLFAPWSNALRVGPFASFDILRQTVNNNFAGGQFLGTTTQWFATTGAKAGVVVSPDVFIYGLAGASWLNEDLNVKFATASSSNVTIPGVTLGLGAEFRPASWQIAGHPVTLSAQYQHTWWSTADFNAPASSPGFNYAFRREDDTVKLGVNFYFGAAPALPPASPSYPVKAPALK